MISMKSFTFASALMLLLVSGGGVSGTSPNGYDTQTPVDTSASYPPYVMAQIDKLHAQGITGKGIKIALIGTGVDYKHPAFGNCFGKGCVITGGYDFVGDEYDVIYSPKPEPKDDPLEIMSYGIGTRQASAISAQATKHFNFTGVAPGAELLVYKVTGPRFSSTAELVAKAIDRAVEDGANIIISFTDDLLYYQDKRPAIQAAERAVRRGVSVMVGIDSQSDLHGHNQFFRVDSLSAAKGVETVGKFDTDRNIILLSRASSKTTTTTMTMTNETQQLPFLYQSFNHNATSAQVDLPLYSIESDACTALPASVPDLSGYMVLVKAGVCDIITKAANLEAKKGKGYIMLYTADGGYLGNEIYTFKRFAGAVNAEVGDQWVKQLKSGANITVHIDAGINAINTLAVGSPALYGGAVHDSYFGPSQSLEIKPIYGAPSATILSAKWRDAYEVDDYNGQGNSMVAGAYALIAQARGIKPTPENIQTLLANTAKAQLFHDGTKFVPGVLASVAQQGAGIIQVYDAAYTKASVTPISIPFNDTEHALKEAELSLINHNTIAVTYSLKTIGAKTIYLLNDRQNETQTDAVVDVVLNKNSITIQPGQSAKFKVTPNKIDLPNADKLPLWSGYVTINGTDGTNLAVPYLGVQGSLYKVDPFSSGPNIYSKGHFFPKNGTFDFGPGGKVYAHATIVPALGVPVVEVYVQSVDESGNPDGKIDSLIDQGPYQAEAKYSNIQVEMGLWRGKLASGGQVPEGKYRLRVRGLRLFGDASKDQDWQNTRTIYFNIVYSDENDPEVVKAKSG